MCKENALRCMEVLGESSENCHGLYIFLEMYMKLCDHHMISCLMVHIIGCAVTRQSIGLPSVPNCLQHKSTPNVQGGSGTEMESLGCTSKLWYLCTSGATALVLIRAYQCSLQFLALEFVKGMMAMGLAIFCTMSEICCGCQSKSSFFPGR